MAKEKNDMPQQDHVEAQAAQQTGQRVRMRIDERELQTNYANAFRANGTAEEVVLDFGLNMPVPSEQQDQLEIVFKICNRIVMNYYSTKRLAITLTQLIRRHEEQYGELEMDVAKRQKGNT